VAEWFKAPVLKTGRRRKASREFESHPFRQLLVDAKLPQWPAGSAIFKPILDVAYEDWSRALAVNLTGPFLCVQAAALLLRDSGGWRYRQHHFHIRPSRFDAAYRLRHKQSRPCTLDTTTGDRTRVATGESLLTYRRVHRTCGARITAFAAARSSSSHFRQQTQT
jgi:NAD(P)-dependent dehydrogenase (short-subunit alcohol dehydrogenase family)